MGVHFAGEGPDRLKPAPLPVVFRYGTSRLTLVAFTSPSCEICAGLRSGIRALEQEYQELTVHIVDHRTTTSAIFTAFRLASTPYVVAVDGEGLVRARVVANSLEQIEMTLGEAMTEAEPV
ncbi:MAG: hypothetical protein ACRD2W_09130 [Acidimicrobiales bacterium]